MDYLLTCAPLTNQSVVNVEVLKVLESVVSLFACVRVIISLVYLVFQDHINVKEPRNSEEPRNSDIHSLNPSTSVQCTMEDYM